jgi:hypothetical protein
VIHFEEHAFHKAIDKKIRIATEIAGVWHRPPAPPTPGSMNGIQLESPKLKLPV